MVLEPPLRVAASHSVPTRRPRGPGVREGPEWFLGTHRAVTGGLSITAIVIVLVVSVLSSLRMHPGEEVWPDGRVP